MKRIEWSRIESSWMGWDGIEVDRNEMKGGREGNWKLGIGMGEAAGMYHPLNLSLARAIVGWLYYSLY